VSYLELLAGLEWKLSKRILEDLKEAVVVGNVKKARRIAEQIGNSGLPANLAFDKLMEAMRVVDERYERKEYFVIDVASSASAMREAFKALEPYLEVEKAMTKGRIVIGSLKGNIQGLGKDIVAATLRSAGFLVVDLGVDVAPAEFVSASIREKAQIIAISVSMEETIPHLKEVVDILEKAHLRDKMKIIVGGSAVSSKVAENYGLDAYALDAQDCSKKAEALLS